MTVRKIGRRFFLLGAGGAMLSIPALRSILPKAHAQDPATPRRMVSFMTGHGGVWQPEMFPRESMAGERLAHPVHDGHRGRLTPEVEGGETVLSPTLRAAALTPALVSKMNVLRGLDVPFYYGHAAHILGSYGPLTSTIDTPELIVPDNVTADQVLARSSAVYPFEPRLRTMALSDGGVAFRDPAMGPAGGFRPVERLSPRAFFDAVFVPSTEPTPEPIESPLESVQESYRRLLAGRFGAGSRLSRADRRRLEQYLETLSTLEAGRGAPVGASCDEVGPIAGLEDEPIGLITEENYRRINQLIVAAFMCDSCRVVHANVDTYSWGGVSMSHDDWHATDPRASDEGTARTEAHRARQLTQTYFATALMDLVTQLDSISDGEGTLLDNSLVWWASECGASTHHGDSIPVVSFGSAGGRIATGNYLDFRNRSTPEFTSDGFSGGMMEGRHPGVSFFQWTTTYLDAFGVPRSEWQPEGRVAFSHAASSLAASDFGDGWDREAMEAASVSPLPGVLT
ncbi:MAG: DUF1552 domain-containing protein [Myxococcota bacterium]